MFAKLVSPGMNGLMDTGECLNIGSFPLGYQCRSGGNTPHEGRCIHGLGPVYDGCFVGSCPL